jgi:lysophospholipase L1-like esterase
MATGFTQVSASALKDANGVLVSNATISFHPVNNSGVPISFKAGGGGQVMSIPVTAQVTNGVFTIQLADSTMTSPVNVGYAVSVIDNVSGKSLLGAGYSCVQPSGTTWSFDTFVPNLPSLALVQTGPQGDSAYAVAVSNGFVGTQAQWIASLKGIPGDLQLQSVSNYLSATRPVVVNLFDRKRGLTAGTYIVPTTGATASNSGFSATGFIPVPTGGTITCSSTIPSGAAGYAFYDVSQTYISGSGSGAAAGTPISVPTNAAYIRISLSGSPNVNTLMVVNGSSLPSVYVSFAAPTENMVADISTTIVEQIFPPGNLFDITRITASAAVSTVDGTVSAQSSSFFASDYILVRGASSIVSNANLHQVAPFGIAFYDTNKNFIGTAAAPSSGQAYAAGTPITVIPSACFARITFGNPDNVNTTGVTANNLMIVGGTTVPSAYVDFMGSKMSPTKAADIAIGIVNQLVGQKNLFDISRITNAFAITSATGALTSVSSGFFASDYILVRGIGTFVSNAFIRQFAPFGIAFYDQNKVYLSTVSTPPSSGQSYAPGTAIAVPSNAYWMRLTFGDNDQISNGVVRSNLVIVGGTTVPSTYIPYVMAQSAASVSPLFGKRGFWFGDSIGTFNPGIQSRIVSFHNCTLPFIDSRWGRTMAQIFECYGASNAATTPALNQAITSTATGGNGTYTNVGSGFQSRASGIGGIIGNTLAQDIGSYDFGIIELGTNQAVTLGTMGDLPSAGTFYGDTLNAIQQLSAVNVTARLIFLSPYRVSRTTDAQNNAVLKALRDVCGEYGIPVIDQLDESSISSLTAATYLTDGIHPNQAGFDRITAHINRMLMGIGF